MKIVPFNTLQGLTMQTVTQGESLNNDALFFITTDGHRYVLTHEQDCCESVVLEDVTGDLADLIGHPLLMAEEVSSEPPETRPRVDSDDSETWTFYKLATIKGSVTLRWYGTSNGYYSEDVWLLDVGVDA